MVLKNVFRLIGLFLGIYLVWQVIHYVGWEAIRETLVLLRWGYVIVLSYPVIWILSNTMGWWMVLPQERSLSLSFWKFILIRMAGETFNALLPSGYVAGEPLKAKLLSHYLSLREATASVLIAKAAQSVGLVVYVGGGLLFAHPAGLAYLRKPLPLAAFLFLTIGISLFVWLLAHRSFSRVAALAHRMTGHPWIQKQEEKLIALDVSLGTFFRRNPKTFVKSTLFFTAGWMAGAMELVVLFHLMGHPLTWRQAWFMGSLAQIAVIMGFISPAGLGFFEGAHYAAAIVLGIPPEWAISASLIRRVRELFWNAIGIGIYMRTGAGLGVPGKETVTS